jgi:hypothetical protein
MLTKFKKQFRSNMCQDALRLDIRDSWSESERTGRRREALVLQDGLLELVEPTKFAKPACKSVHHRELVGTH